jgi:hypothetical protein
VIVVDVQLSFREYLKSVYAFFWRNKAGILFFLWLFVILGVNAGLVVVQYENLWQFFIFPTLYVVLSWLRMFYSAKCTWEQQPEMGERTRYTLSDQSLRLDSPSLVAEYKWSSFLRMTTTKSCFLLFTHETLAFAFPFASFASAEDKEGFHQFVLAHLSEGKAMLVNRNKRRLSLISVAMWLLIMMVFVTMLKQLK